MTGDVDVNKQLAINDLFELFRVQLVKDFEGAGINTDFLADLPRLFNEIKVLLSGKINMLSRDASALSALLYRVDISEKQLRDYGNRNDEPFHDTISELIIKRVLQKVIIKKKFSGK